MAAVTLKEYFAESQSGFTQKDAQIIGPALDRLFEKGLIMAEDVVKEAAPPTSELHSYFEWDNAKAGQLYRVTQAKRMIRSIEVRSVSAVGTKPLRAYVPARDDSEGDGGFVAVNVIRKDSKRAHKISTQAKRELDLWRLRYGSYVAIFPDMEMEFRRICEAVDSITSKFEEDRVAERVDRNEAA